MGSQTIQRFTARIENRLAGRTVRLRLTLLYGAMFCLCGVVLLAITYLLVSHFSGHVVQVSRQQPPRSVHSTGATGARLPALPSLAEMQREAQRELVSQHDRDLTELLVWSAVAFAVTAVGSLALGWLIAGRVLAPLRTMISTTRRISQDTMHERLALPGPADELKELGDTIDALLARLETAFDAQRRFVANASHELRTPLARIRTALDVAVGKPGPIPPELLALDIKLREGLDRAERLMEELLALGRAEHGELSDRDILALDALVNTAITEHQRDICAQQITVEQDLEPVLVSGSSTLLSRMVENLIDNGVRHNRAGGWLHVALKTSGQLARLAVESSGDTLDASEVQKLTQPFRRLRTDRTGSIQGSGLGLSIVAAITAAHGGVLALDARDGGGLRVTIDLLVAPDPRETNRTAIQVAPPAVGEGAR